MYQCYKSEIGRLFFKIKYFTCFCTAVPLKMCGEIWPIKIDFGRPNGEVGRKMANGGLLFLALMYVQGKG